MERATCTRFRRVTAASPSARRSGRSGGERAWPFARSTKALGRLALPERGSSGRGRRRTSARMAGASKRLASRRQGGRTARGAFSPRHGREAPPLDGLGEPQPGGPSRPVALGAADLRHAGVLGGVEAESDQSAEPFVARMQRSSWGEPEREELEDRDPTLGDREAQTVEVGVGEDRLSASGSRSRPASRSVAAVARRFPRSKKERVLSHRSTCRLTRSSRSKACRRCGGPHRGDPVTKNSAQRRSRCWGPSTGSSSALGGLSPGSRERFLRAALRSREGRGRSPPRPPRIPVRCDETGRAHCRSVRGPPGPRLGLRRPLQSRRCDHPQQMAQRQGRHVRIRRPVIPGCHGRERLGRGSCRAIHAGTVDLRGHSLDVKPRVAPRGEGA